MAAKESQKTQSALEVLDSLSLESIDAEIAVIDGKIAELDKTREALKAARRFVDIRDNGRPERKKPVRRNKAAAAPAVQRQASSGEYVLPANRAQLSRDGDDTRAKTNREKIRDYLLENPRATQNLIGIATGITHGSLSGTLSQHKDLFKSNGDGTWSLVNKRDD